jgi:hypothetical protein
MATSDTSTGPTERARTGTATPEPVGDSRPRRTLATYPSYAQAERAVDWLSDQGSPSSMSRSWARACARWSR